MRTEVRKADTVEEYDTSERCAILEVANDAGDANVSIARARVASGVTTAWHRLIDTEERYLLVAGEGCVELGEQIRTPVTPGDVVRIPAGVPQRIVNTGADDLVFYAICSPRFRAACYVSLE